MLVLSRKKGESILIGTEIEIIILDTDKDGIKIGINAPKEIPVLRNELYLQTKDSNLNAAKFTVDKKSLIETLKKMKKK